MRQQISRDGDNVLNGFAQAENDFGNAVAQLAVMVDAGKTEILEWQVAHAMESRIDIGRAGAYIFEERAKLSFCHC